MAYVVTNKNYSLTFISKDLEQASFQYGGLGIYLNGHAGYVIEISDADFIALQTSQKEYAHNGTSMVLTDKTSKPFANETELKSYIDNVTKTLNTIINKHSDNSYKAECVAYKSLLENLDTSTITYPLNKSLEKHLYDLGHPILSPLQLL